MICSKCNVEKPVEQYSTYFHSTQQKWRTRKVCKTCFNEQKKIYKQTIKLKKITQPESPESVIDHSNNPDYKLCSGCKTYKPKTQYYYHKDKYYSPACKECSKQRSTERLSKLKADNGGSLMVPQKCNSYFDEYQKKNTFELMEVMGYLFDEETGIWWKPNVKEIRNGKPFFFKVKKPKFKNSKKMDQELFEKIVELRKKNFTYGMISNKLNLSNSTVQKYLKLHEEGN